MFDFLLEVFLLEPHWKGDEEDPGRFSHFCEFVGPLEAAL